MAAKEELKKKIKTKINELKLGLNMKDEDFKEYEPSIKEIIDLIDKEKMEKEEFTILDEIDQNRFINYYNEKGQHKESSINKYLQKFNNDFQKILAKMEEKKVDKADDNNDSNDSDDSDG